MLSIICAIACVILVILDICGKLYLEKTKPQVLLNLFCLLGAATPVASDACSNCITGLLGTTTLDEMTETGEWKELLLTQGLPDWIIAIAAIICALAWVYTLVRTATCTKIISPQESPVLAAKRHLTVTWISLPFFLLMLVIGVIYLVVVLSLVGMYLIALLLGTLIFPPVLIIGAILVAITSIELLLPMLPVFGAMLIPYITGVFYSNRYLIACAVCFGWKKPLRIFLQVLLFLPWIRWIVVCCCMGKMQKYQRLTGQ
ncbi:MAG: hypothetical protein ACI4XB_09860 [Ruminococcus sp.]